MNSYLPKLNISVSHIRDNTQILSELYGHKGISLMGVSKAVLGDPTIVAAMIQGGVQFIADSRLANIQRMKRAGLLTQFVLLRTALSQASAVVQWVDISLNTEITTLRALNAEAKAQHKLHRVIIMIELGDLREGILPCDLDQFMTELVSLEHIKVVGLGSNLACYGGAKPTVNNMTQLSDLSNRVEQSFPLALKYISGGNSANYQWYQSCQDPGRINNLRIGESILLGRETVDREIIPGLQTQAFQLVGEVIESKFKPSLPSGEPCQDAFGLYPTFVNRGIRQRAIVALGRQDVLISGLIPPASFEVLGSSSDHLILESPNQNLQVGDEVVFGLNYGALLSAMTSSFIQKCFV